MLDEMFIFPCDECKIQQGYSILFSEENDIYYIGRDPEKCGKNAIIFPYDSIAPCQISLKCSSNGDITLYRESEGNIILNGIPIEKYHYVAPYSHLTLGNINFRLYYSFSLNQNNDEQNSETVKQDEKNIHEHTLDNNKKEKIALLEDETVYKHSNECAEAFVIAEFSLLNLDQPHSTPQVCEIMSDQHKLTIGKDASCAYKIESDKAKYVADIQAIIFYSSEEQLFSIQGVVIENPIFVNKQKVLRKQPLKSGDIIKLGIASNAPRIQFSININGEAQKYHFRLSDFVDSLERGRIYTVGSGNNCDISLPIPEIQNVCLEFSVPEQGENLYVQKIENKNIKIFLDNSELMEHEKRIWNLHQSIEIEDIGFLIHDQINLVSAPIPQEIIFSQVVERPKRGDTYFIGKGEFCTFKIDTTASCPEKIAEIFVPWEGEYFLVKSTSSIPVFIDDLRLDHEARLEYHYGVNQILRIGNFLKIQNNHRTLPMLSNHYPWKTFLSTLFWLCVIIALVLLAVVYGEEHWKKFQNFVNSFAKNEQSLEEVQDIPGKPENEQEYNQEPKNEIEKSENIDQQINETSETDTQNKLEKNSLNTAEERLQKFSEILNLDKTNSSKDNLFKSDKANSSKDNLFKSNKTNSSKNNGSKKLTEKE